MPRSDGPNEVTQSSRQVIEHKLLAALDDGETVAVIFTHRDLDLLISILSKFAAGKCEAEQGRFRSSDEAGEELRAREISLGLEQLRREAFGE